MLGGATLMLLYVIQVIISSLLIHGVSKVFSFIFYLVILSNTDALARDGSEIYSIVLVAVSGRVPTPSRHTVFSLEYAQRVELNCGWAPSVVYGEIPSRLFVGEQ